MCPCGPLSLPGAPAPGLVNRNLAAGHHGLGLTGG
jgi:hypothetical protein